MMVGSASSLKAYISKGNSYYYFFRQLFFILVGLGGSFFVILTPIKRYKKLIYLALIGVIGAITSPVTPISLHRLIILSLLGPKYLIFGILFLFLL